MVRSSCKSRTRKNSGYLMDDKLNIFYKGEKFAEDLSFEDAADTLHDLAIKFFENDDTNPEDIAVNLDIVNVHVEEID
jgi:hypothetical protein